MNKVKLAIVITQLLLLILMAGLALNFDNNINKIFIYIINIIMILLMGLNLAI